MKYGAFSQQTMVFSSEGRKCNIAMQCKCEFNTVLTRVRNGKLDLILPAAGFYDMPAARRCFAAVNAVVVGESGEPQLPPWLCQRGRQQKALNGQGAHILWLGGRLH